MCDAGSAACRHLQHARLLPRAGNRREGGREGELDHVIIIHIGAIAHLASHLEPFPTALFSITCATGASVCGKKILDFFLNSKIKLSANILALRYTKFIYHVVM